MLRQMFEQMAEKKDPLAIDRFYHPSFVMYSNGLTQDFEAFSASHRNIYATPICYSVEYDEQAWVEATDKVAGRMWITTSRPGDSPTHIEVVFDRRFHRRPNQPPLGKDVAKLEHFASLRNLRTKHIASASISRPRAKPATFAFQPQPGAPGSQPPPS